MSSTKPKAKLSVKEQVKAARSAAKDFLASRSVDAEIATLKNKDTRKIVAGELLATLSGGRAGKVGRTDTQESSSGDTQEIPRCEPRAVAPDKGNDAEGISQSDAGEGSLEQQALEDSKQQALARKPLVDQGYFDEAVQNLRAAISPAERAAAARALGLVGSKRGTPHLIAAMFDEDLEVRTAAEEALSQIGEPALGDAQINALMNNESETVNELQSAMGELYQQDREPERASRKVVIDSAKADVQPVEEDAGATEVGVTIEQSSSEQTTSASLTAINSISTSEEEQLLLEENGLRERVAQLTGKLLDVANAREESEQQFQKRITREATLRTEAAVRRSQEEELRKRAAEEAERLRVQEQEAIAAEQVARTNAESETQRFVETETSLRLKITELKLSAERLARARATGETRRREVAEAAVLAEATRARDEAKLRHDGEVELLRKEEKALHATIGKIALRRSQVEIAREKADADAAHLLEAQTRMQAAEEARAEAEAARSQLEAEINERVKTARRLLEESHRRGEEEQQRVQEETRRRAEEEKQRLAELEAMRTKAEANSRQLAQKEQQILSELNSLRIADAETRKRIEDAEVRRRAAEDAYRLVAEKVQRVEAEAHSRVKEEEQMLAKLGAERRTVAVEAQSRATQEKRIRDEIEMFRRLEDQERPRLEVAILQRAEAEARLQQWRERLRAEEEARVSADEELKSALQAQVSLTETSETSIWQKHRAETAFEPISFVEDKSTKTVADTLALDSEVGAPSDRDLHEIEDVDNVAAASVTPSVLAYLNSVDPYKRAAAVAELARSGSKDAFSLIVNCFDDHSAHVRNAAARAFRKLEPNRTVDLFNRALEEASPDRRRNIGAAIAASGLASEATDNLVSENREDTYNALSILFVMAKTGEVQPLIQAIEGHEDVQIRMAAIKLLTLTGQPDVANAAAKRRLAEH